MSTLEEAIILAAKAHQGALDKAGAPYILHPLRVMLRMRTQTERIVAVLHDVLEDTDWTAQKLREAGFSEEILAALAYLTRNQGEPYDAFIRRAGSLPMARRVKLADLEDNLDPGRITRPNARDRERLAKYEQAKATLLRMQP